MTTSSYSNVDQLAAEISTEPRSTVPLDTAVIGWNLDQIRTFDPGMIGEINAALIIQNIYRPLVTFDYGSPPKIIPGIASSWSRSADGLTLVFKLTPGLRFPSGRLLTSDDVVWSLRRVLHLDGFGAVALRSWGFAESDAARCFEAVDPETVVVRLDKPYPSDLILSAVFAGRLASVLDKREVEKHSLNGDYGSEWLKSNSAGMGPFRITGWNHNCSLTLDRNENWTGGPMPTMRRVIVRHIPDPVVQCSELERGNIDVAMLLRPEDLSRLAASNRARVISVLQAGSEYLALNLQDPILGRPEVVQAFRWMVDYQGLRSGLLKYEGIPRSSMVPLNAFGALGEFDGLPYRMDLDRARQLLLEAGVTHGFRRTMLLAEVWPVHLPLGRHIQESAAKLGIEIDLEPVAQKILFERGRKREFDMMLHGWVSGYPDAHAILARMAVNPDNRLEARLISYPSWRVGFKSEWVNDMAQQALMECDPNRRQTMYHALQLWLMRFGPNVHIYQNSRPQALGTWVSQFHQSAYQMGFDTIKKHH